MPLQYTNDGGGLLFMRARYYSSYLMRFVSADALVGSVSDPVTLNRYAYALGNPILYVDPFGRSAVLVSGGHAALDVAGFIPVAGALFDVANGVWYAVEGDWSMAGLSVLGAVPVAGDVASGAKIGAKAISGAADAISAAGKSTENLVYLSKTADGTVQYVGITNDVARRAAEHLSQKGIQIRPLMNGLSRSDARSVEQALIEIHGLEKNGGTLINKINSIAETNPSYAASLERGYELLQSIGYK